MWPHRGTHPKLEVWTLNKHRELCSPFSGQRLVVPECPGNIGARVVCLVKCGGGSHLEKHLLGSLCQQSPVECGLVPSSVSLGPLSTENWDAPWEEWGALRWPVACCLSQPPQRWLCGLPCVHSPLRVCASNISNHSHREVGEEVPGTSQGLWCMLCLFPHRTGLILQSVQKLVWVLGGSEARGIRGDPLSSALPWPRGHAHLAKAHPQGGQCSGKDFPSLRGPSKLGVGSECIWLVPGDTMPSA